MSRAKDFLPGEFEGYPPFPQGHEGRAGGKKGFAANSVGSGAYIAIRI